jgi:UPF0755 protein
VSDLFLGTPAHPHAEPAASRRSRQRGKARKAKERRKRRRRSGVVIVVAAALVLAAGYIVWSIVGPMFGGSSGADQIDDYPGPGSGTAQVVVAQGDTGGAIGAKLVDAGIVATVPAFTSAYAANPEAQGIQPGTYALQLEMKASDAVAALLNTANRVSLKVTVIEGLTKNEIFTRINEVTAIPVADLEAALADPAAGLPAEAGGNPEGWLAPATYLVEPGATAVSVVQQMTAKTVAVLTAKGVAQDQWLDVLTRASLVEREARNDADRPIMAQTIQNRLDIDMHLQIDASLAYGLGKNGTALTTADKDVDNAYNLEINTGLPPTPIAAPGEKSIDAVLNPTPGDFLFWTAINLETGETRFSETYPEHLENVALLREWQAANPSS